MRADPKRLKRLQRLERFRAIARQGAAREAAEAEGTLAQLRGLAERTRGLARDYADRRDIVDASGLRQIASFMSGLQDLGSVTEADAERAQSMADTKQVLLAEAERRRAAAEDRAAREARSIAESRSTPVIAARKPIGTPLE
ncbi:hypothetical protein GCM10011371_30580 [Novosphingobium marinum]|uniref:Flagellar FliJ protein n=1 Tax=Novosphingobium marinum TaxID=1514948 RepID=A0A7Y9XUV4_9SPHN|nr:hypothetical protein [Novosphingobium marinum]NYH94989.1 hypothetical protein [Novosphingobium marinum]GGC41025.1 hypothetical protein GCM10011371_30580 [Novosphingobium marinum]